MVADLRLARRLQEEEEQRSQQLANQEADDFKKLQVITTDIIVDRKSVV